MNALGILQVLVAAVVFIAVVQRLAVADCRGGTLGARVMGNLWVAAHVLLAIGALCLAFDLLRHALGFTFAGLALYLAPRWRRRSDDR